MKKPVFPFYIINNNGLFYISRDFYVFCDFFLHHCSFYFKEFLIWIVLSSVLHIFFTFFPSLPFEFCLC